MERARRPTAGTSFPVKQSVGQVGRLLELKDDDSSAEGVNRAWRIAQDVAGEYLDLLEDVRQSSRSQCRLQIVTGQRPIRAVPDDRSRIGRHDVPRLGLAKELLPQPTR